MSHVSVVVTQLEVTIEATCQANTTGRAFGAVTIFNPAPAPPSSALESLPFADMDIVCPNETEAEALTGVPVADDAGVVAAAQKLLDMGVSCVVITLGARGCYAAIAGSAGADTTWGRFIEAPGLAAGAHVVDTTGAGDAFIGTLAHSLVEARAASEAKEGGSEAEGVCVGSHRWFVPSVLEWTCRRAAHAATLSVTKAGTQTSYPGAEEVKAWDDEHPVPQ